MSTPDPRHRPGGRGPGLPNIEVNDSGPWGAYPYSVGRLARTGQGALRWSTFTTKARVEDMVPDGFEPEFNYQIGVNWTDEYERIVTMVKDNVYITVDEQEVRVDVVVWSPDLNELPRVDHYMAEIKSRAIPIPVAPDDHVETAFWRLTPDGPDAKIRRLEVPTWEDIQDNYTAAAKISLGELMGMDHTTNPDSGNIIVLHGPAGTGKTTALRSLARSWKTWADVHYIVDPDAFLQHADYMWQAILTQTGFADERWKLLIMEDVDELIKEGAKAQVGQAFSRLLNLGDGFLGQGLRVIIVLTTNEPVGNLSEAISRPGRCLAHIEVPKFSASEAASWLTNHHPERRRPAQTGEYTLAEMYEEMASHNQIVAEPLQNSLGQYL